MAYLSQIEAAVKLGYSVELLDALVKKCPKRGEKRKLKATKSDSGLLFDDDELVAYQCYLNRPWPMTEKESRPYMPAAIKKDIKQESHHACAICGHMDNGEVAHIREVSKTLDNSPDNLIYLCPNHHTKYDYGFIFSNLTQEEVEAAKLIKRNSRRRMLRYEANTVRRLKGLIEFVASLEADLKKEITESTREALLTELKSVVEAVPELCKEAEEAARADIDAAPLEKRLGEIAPEIAKRARGVTSDDEEHAIRDRVKSILTTSKKVLITLDEVECPHCHGRGQVGLVGTLCSYCRGGCFVSQAEADTYDRSNIDEVECPRCGGRGQTGLVGDLCAYCGGECVVSQEGHDAYDPDDIDEVECPHCHGDGQYGWNNLICMYCDGSCVVSIDKAEGYDPDDIDEVPCPHCGGSGEIGWAGDACGYCKGDGRMAKKKRDAYNPDDIDEVECPHCHGSGQRGWNNLICVYCGGSCVVSNDKAEGYDPDDIDEVPCPHCHGSGQKGHSGDACGLCNGDCVVSRTKNDAYEEKYG